MPDESDLPSKWAHEDSAHLNITRKEEAYGDIEQPLLIYTDRRQAIKKMHRRMLVASPFFILYCCWCMYMFSASVLPLILIAMAPAFIIYLQTFRTLSRNTAPLLTIDSKGIKVHGLYTRCFVSWDNLGKVEPYTMIYRFIGINPKSVFKVDAAPGAKLFLLVNAFCRVLYGLIGQKCYAISVPEQYSHFEAEDICEQIEARRVHYTSISSSHSESVKAIEPAIHKAIAADDEVNSHVIKLKESAASKLTSPED